MTDLPLRIPATDELLLQHHTVVSIDEERVSTFLGHALQSALVQKIRVQIYVLVEDEEDRTNSYFALVDVVKIARELFEGSMKLRIKYVEGGSTDAVYVNVREYGFPRTLNCGDDAWLISGATWEAVQSINGSATDGSSTHSTDAHHCITSNGEIDNISCSSRDSPRQDPPTGSSAHCENEGQPPSKRSRKERDRILQAVQDFSEKYLVKHAWTKIGSVDEKHSVKRSALLEAFHELSPPDVGDVETSTLMKYFLQVLNLHYKTSTDHHKTVLYGISMRSNSSTVVERIMQKYDLKEPEREEEGNAANTELELESLLQSEEVPWSRLFKKAKLIPEAERRLLIGCAHDAWNSPQWRKCLAAALLDSDENAVILPEVAQVLAKNITQGRMSP